VSPILTSGSIVKGNGLSLDAVSHLLVNPAVMHVLLIVFDRNQINRCIILERLGTGACSVIMTALTGIDMRWPLIYQCYNKNGGDTMKVLRLLLYGLLICILANVVLLVASLPFGIQEDVNPIRQNSINAFLAALPLGLISFFCALLNRTASRKEALLSGSVWTACLLVMFTLIGLGNQTLDVVFLAPGMYALFAGVFLGPIAYARFSKLV
jgi:hypothetical protein